MSAPDPERHLLSEADSERIFREEIVPERLAGADRQQAPIVVFVAGQPGAGKTKTQEAVEEQLRARGGFVGVSGDFYRAYHPLYHELLAQDDKLAAFYTSLDARRWIAKALDHLQQERCHLVVETTMRDDRDYADPARRFHAAGYRVETVILAVPQAQSRIGILSRYHEQVKDRGRGRMTATSTHTAAYQGILDTADVIDRGTFADVVAVMRRGNVLLYSNHRGDDGQWVRAPSTRAAIETERARRWSLEETRAFAATAQALGSGMDPHWRTQIREVVALARPLIAAEDQHLLDAATLAAQTGSASSGPARAAQAFPVSTRDALPRSDGPPPSQPQPRRGAGPGRDERDEQSR